MENRAEGERMSLPCMRDKCIGKECGNFNDPSSKFFNSKIKPGCKGGAHPPWSWARWYIEHDFTKKEKQNEDNSLD